jgi:hypothetical protein
MGDLKKTACAVTIEPYWEEGKGGKLMYNCLCHHRHCDFFVNAEPSEQQPFMPRYDCDYEFKNKDSMFTQCSNEEAKLNAREFAKGILCKEVG